jgi:hypothetical protein
VPIGLINGNTYREGLRPPFHPRTIMDAVREVIRRPEIPDQELAVIVGPPFFVTGCEVITGQAALAAGRRTELRLRARVSLDDDRGQVVIGNFPPNVSTDDAAQIIASRAGERPWADDHPRLHRLTRLPLAGVRDETTERTDPFGRLICTPSRGTSPEELRDMLLDVPGVCTSMPARLPQPLPALIRHWVQANADEDLLASLDALQQAMGGPTR